EGIRWDAVRFALDVARPGDRIALVIFRGEPLVLTRYADPSGFVKLDDAKRFGGKTARQWLEDLIADIQKREVKHAEKNRGKKFNDPSLEGLDLNELRPLLGNTAAKLEPWPGTSVVKA